MKITGNTAAVLIVGFFTLVALVYAAPPEQVQATAVAVSGLLLTLMASLKPLLTQDDDGDGIPNVLDSTPDGDDEEE